MRVAFFGGSFDPPHAGHLAVARAARAALGLERVLFAPVGWQPLKPGGAMASFEDRVAMTRLAIAGEAGFAVSLLDAPAAGLDKPNYTIDTLARLRAELPADAELYCLVGADSLAGLRRWHRGAEIPFAARLVVAARPGQPLAELAGMLPAGVTLAEEPVAVDAPEGIALERALLRDAAGATAPLYLLPGLDVDLSATELRRQMRDPLRHPGLAQAVFTYIEERGMYR